MAATKDNKGAVDALHKLVTGMLIAVVVGGFKFVVDTQTEIALLKQGMTQVRTMSSQILQIVEAAHPRQP